MQEPVERAVAEAALIVQHLSAGFRVIFVLDDQWWLCREGGR
jgi:hypothetical protein